MINSNPSYKLRIGLLAPKLIFFSALLNFRIIKPQ